MGDSHSTNVKDQHRNIRQYSKRRRKISTNWLDRATTRNTERQRQQRTNRNRRRILEAGRQHRKPKTITSTSEANGRNVNKYNNNRNIELRACNQEATAFKNASKNATTL